MKRASTVIVVRRSDNAVLMVGRKSSNRAFAGAMVFPGGVQEEADTAVPAVEASRVCALRELFEETGMLLGKQKREEDEALRRPCSKDASLFRRVYSEGQLKAAAQRLKPWSVWLTPQQEPYRYDTSFFALAVTDDEAAAAVHDNDEVVSSQFAAPEVFLSRHAKGEMFLVPPTWVTLNELLHLKTVDAVLSSARSMVPIEPTLLKTPEQIVVCLPGDLNHHASPPTATALRRIVMSPGQPFRWVDTINKTVVPTSSL